MAAAGRRMEDRVYKIFTEDEWNRFQATGQFSGSADDIRDGFIHLSTKDQVARVIKKFFAGKGRLHVAEFSAKDFIRRLSWEPSASGDVYPHLYDCELSTADVSGSNFIAEPDDD